MVNGAGAGGRGWGGGLIEVWDWSVGKVSKSSFMGSRTVTSCLFYLVNDQRITVYHKLYILILDVSQIIS